MLFDTHAHVYSEYYDDIQKVIDDSKHMGVDYIISDGVDDKTNKELINIVDKYPNMFITLGIHPEDIKDFTSENLKFIEDNLDNPKVVAIGEIGLDYHFEDYDKEKQKLLFETQLILAEKHHLPVVVHSRDATLDTLNILKKHNVKGVIHCFSGSYETAVQYIKMGYKLGVNGVSTFKNSKIKEVIKKIGKENILLETDSPYLSPEPVRGTKNIPGNTMHVAKFIANYLEISLDDLLQAVYNNTLSVFDKINIQ